MKIDIKTETELENLMIPLLIDHFNLVIFKRQVPHHQFLIDATAIDWAGKTYSFEFKLHAWRQVVDQARKHLNSFDYNYVCMPHAAVANRVNYVLIENAENKINNRQRIEKIQSACEYWGIGCILYGRGILIPTWPARGFDINDQRLLDGVNIGKWKPNYNRMREYLESNRGQIVPHRRTLK